MFLRKQSRNSLANWWSVCFKMFFSNGFICGVASTGSATVYENYFYALLFYFLNAKVFILELLFKWAKLAKFIRSEASWKLYIFYHKVLGDVVKRWRFWGLWGTLEIVKTWSWNILLFEEILHYAALRSEWHGSVFLLTIRNLNYFWNAKILNLKQFY